MNKLGSEFIKEFDTYERPVMFGLTTRQLVLFLGVIIVGALSTIILLMGLSQIFVYLVTFLIAPPFLLYGTGYDDVVKERVLFNLKVQKRAYLTEFEEGRF